LKRKKKQVDKSRTKSKNYKAKKFIKQKIPIIKKRTRVKCFTFDESLSAACDDLEEGRVLIPL
jgi:hypothetical protein